MFRHIANYYSFLNMAFFNVLQLFSDGKYTKDYKGYELYNI